jgi:hypothetical protein
VTRRAGLRGSPGSPLPPSATRCAHGLPRLISSAESHAK